MARPRAHRSGPRIGGPYQGYLNPVARPLPRAHYNGIMRATVVLRLGRREYIR